MISKTCNTFGKFAALFSFAMLSFPLFSQTQWPATVSLGGMTIQIFKPEIESFDKDRISLRAALVITEGEENVFGSAWVDAASQSSKTSRTISLLNAKVVDLRFPDGYEAGGESALIAAVERGFAGVTIKMEDVLADLDKTRGEQDLSKKLNNAPPTIFYATRPSILVTIDGDPVLQPTDMAAVEMIVNSPFLILKHGGMFWLSNGSLWYESKSPLKGWTPRGNVPVPVRQTAEALKSDSEEENETEENESFHPDVIVSTVPAELIQTEGAPAFAAIPGTMMLYVTNTTDQIVMDIKSQTYFALLSGRWYSSPRLDGEWRYRAFDELPADFAKIPEGSDKDILLASVPGTKAAKDAVRESLVPQAAIVDRTTASTEVAYDGSPRFEAIEGTSMKYAVNGSSTVILENGRYYAVDDGVWYHSSTPAGPWAVSDARPVQIELIHPSCPIYNVRYVRVYHSTPRYVYVGYTRGYLSSYVCGRVVVYGTGWHYRPWRGRCYYPRPCTWGYGVSYSPWSGWSVGFVYGSGWFRYSHPRAYHSYYPHYRHPVRRSSPRGGWWGPVVYRPPYCVPHTHYYGHSRAQVRTVPHYTIRSSSPRSSRNNVYVYNSGRGVRSGSPARTIASSSGRQNLTRSYGYQARPSSGRQNSQASSGRGSGGRQDSQASPGRGSGGRQDSQASPGRGSGGRQDSQTSPGRGSGGRQDSQASPGRGSGSGGRQDSNSSSGGSGGRQGAQTLPGSSNLSGQQGSQTSPGNSSGGRESTTPGRGSGGGRESTTPGRNSGGGRESTTPGRNSGGSRESQTTPGRNSGGSRESQSTPGRNSGGSRESQSTPGRNSGGSRESTTPGRGPGIGRESQATPGRGSGGGRESQATPGRGSGSSRESLPRQNSVSSGRRESLPRQNSVSSGTNSGGRSNSSAASSSSGSGGRSSAPSSRSGGGRGQGEQQPSRTR